MKLRIHNALLVVWHKTVKHELLNKALSGYVNEKDFTTLDLARFTDEDLKNLQTLAEKSELRKAGTVARRIGQYFEMADSSADKTLVKSLEVLDTMLTKLIKGLPNKWLFGTSKDHDLPFYVKHIQFSPRRPKQPAYVKVTLEFQRSGEAKTTHIMWHFKDLRGGKTVLQLLLEEGYMIEDAKRVVKQSSR